MLQDLSRQILRTRTFRFGNSLQVGLYPDVDRLDSRQIRELAELLDRAKLQTLEQFLDAPFDNPFPGGSRFTDGSFGVYYSAMERETAQIEAHDFYRKIAAEGAKAIRVAYYRCVSCQFDGTIWDLRPEASHMLYLVDNAGEEKCRQLAVEARASAVDGLLTPSSAQVRRSRSGTCLPVFSRKALSAPVEDGGEKFSFEPI